MTDINEGKQKYSNIVKFGVIGVFAAVVAPIAWMAVTGIAGMLFAIMLSEHLVKLSKE